jgi:hypothetical protein
MSPLLSSLLPDFSRKITQDGECVLILSICQKCGAETTRSLADGGSLKQWELSHACDLKAVPTSVTSRPAHS